MMSKIKNIIIFLVIAIVLILGYVFFFKKEPDQGNLVSSAPGSTAPTSNNTESVDLITGDFLSMLLNVKNIKLDESIFTDPAFLTLRDSSILLIPDGSEGRPNPFAPIGFESTFSAPVSSTIPVDTSDLSDQTAP